MGAQISPRAQLADMDVGEDYSFELDLAKRLSAKTVDSYTYTIYNSAGDDVTSTIGGGSTIDVALITFGVKAALAGTYTLKFIVTCNEFLPDGVTPYEIFIEMFIVIS